MTFANPILVGAGSGGVTQAGLGTVTLTNAALGYTGTTAVNSLNRKLIIGTGGAVAVGTTAAVLSNYGDAEFITSSAIALSGTSTGSRDTYITQGGTGIGAGAQLNLNSTADITLPWVTGASTGNTRLIQSGTGTLTLGGSNNLLAESDNSSLGLQVNSGTVVFDKRGSTGFQAGSAFGPGNTGGIGGRALGSSGNNAGDGLIINGGTVRYASTAHADQLFDNVDVRVNGGVLDFNGISDTFDSLLGTGGKLTNGAVGTTSIIGIGAAGSFQAMQYRALANYGGVIEDGLGQIELIKTGTGTQVLSGLNTYTGKTTVLQGFLQIDSETRLGVAAVPMLNQLVFSGANNISGGGLETLVDVTIDDVNRGVWLNRGGGNGDSNAMRPAAGTTLTFATPIAGDGGIQNVGLGTLKLSGANLYHGSTGTFSGGTIALDYTTQNNSKIADAGSLILRGGILNLIGGSHVEVSGSTTIDGGGVNAGASYITRTGGSSTLNLNAITRTNATAGVLNIVGTTVDVSIDGLTTTDSNNINSILVSGAQAGGLTVSQGGLVVTGDAFSNANQINDAPASATVCGLPSASGMPAPGRTTSCSSAARLQLGSSAMI